MGKYTKASLGEMARRVMADKGGKFMMLIPILAMASRTNAAEVVRRIKHMADTY